MSVYAKAGEVESEKRTVTVTAVLGDDIPVWETNFDSIPLSSGAVDRWNRIYPPADGVIKDPVDAENNVGSFTNTSALKGYIGPEDSVIFGVMPIHSKSGGAVGKSGNII